MSFVFRRASTVAALSLAAVIAGCQDAVAPADPAMDAAPRLSAQSRGYNAEPQSIKDQYIVVLRDDAGDTEAVSRRLMAKTKGRLNRVYRAGIRGFAANMTAAEAARLATDPAVGHVEQDQIVTLGVGKPVSGGGGGGTKGGKGKTTPPADTGSVTQTAPPSWGLDRIDQALLPLNNTYQYRATGAGVHVYIVDSGIRTTHTEFGGRASADFSAIDDGNGALDCNWHGTHVAGIVGGRTAGVAKAAALHSVRVLDCSGAGTVSGLIAGLDWVAANRVLPAVANVSVLTAYSIALNEAVDRLSASGVTVVVAAGNNADDACAYSPASNAGALTVAATTSTDTFAAFSNFGSCVDILAPGTDIMSSFYSSDTGLMPASGTSMASPHAAGAAALYLQGNPAALPSIVHDALVLGSTAGAIAGGPSSTPNKILRTT